MTYVSTLWAGAGGPHRFVPSCVLFASLSLPGAWPVHAADATPAAAAPAAAAAAPVGPTDSAELDRLQRALDRELERGRRLEEELSRQQQAAVQNRAEQDGLAAELSDMRNGLNQATAQLETLQTEHQRLTQQLAAAERSLDDARRQVGTLTAERDAALTELQAAQRGLEDRQRELATLSESFDRLERSVADVEQELAARGTTLATTTAERDELSGRLAHTESELEQRSNELAAATADSDATRQQLEAAQNELATAREALAAMTGERDQLNSRLMSSEELGVTLEKRLSDTQGALDGQRAETARLDSDANQLKQQNAALESDLAALRAQLQREQEAGDRLRSDLTTLKAGLPSELGGSASLGQLQAEAAGIAKQMRNMHRTLRRQPGNVALRAEFEAAAQRLRERQLLIAGETGAVGLYRLRPEDTLAAVALRFLGDGNRWDRIYQANRHILNDPDRLIEGLTLVLP